MNDPFIKLMHFYFRQISWTLPPELTSEVAMVYVLLTLLNLLHTSALKEVSKALGSEDL